MHDMHVYNFGNLVYLNFLIYRIYISLSSVFFSLFFCLQTSCKNGGSSSSSPSAGLLEGHLNITRELIALQSSVEKHRIGSQSPGDDLINVSR